MSRIILFFTIFLSMNTTAQTSKKNSVSLKWRKIATLPPSEGQPKSLGFAGPVNGVSNNVFITAGGANFPQGMPWEGGTKHYSDQIFLLQMKGNEFEWINHHQILPEPIAYCGVASTSMGVIYVGGENEQGISKKCFLLQWDPKKEQLLFEPLPDLPFPLTNVAVANHDHTIYAAGGDEKNHSSQRFLSLDLKEEIPEWTPLPDLPFALANASLIAQKGKLYLIGGRTKTASGISELHGTTFVFDIKNKTWKKLAEICDGKNPTNLSAAAGIAIDTDHILMIGGDDGNTFHQIETYLSKISKAATQSEKEKLIKEKNNLLTGHQGFSRKLLVYNIPSDCWIETGTYPYLTQVTTSAVKWNGKIIVSNGEIKPGIRTPDVVEGVIQLKIEN